MKNKTKKIFLLFLFGFVIGLGGFITTFLMYQNKNESNNNDSHKEFADIQNGNIVFLNMDNSLHFEMTPTLDKFGILNEAFSWTIKNVSSNNQNYILSLIDDNSSIKNKFVRYQLIKNNEEVGIWTLSDDGVIDEGNILSGEEITYSIRLWLDYNSDVKIGKLSKKIQINEETMEQTGVINNPILLDGMIPVYYDEDKMAFCKSSIENTYNRKWYDYDKGIWANAVTVDISKRNYYMDSAVGTEIMMEDINSMWVWIPRFNVTINNQVNISFVNENALAYRAFNFNDSNLSGFWISKFEAGIDENSVCATTSMVSKCNTSNNVLLFKPNVLLMNKITMANLFYNIRKMELKNNIYGFLGGGTKVETNGLITKDNNNFDIHMIKNSEWDAVSFLALSSYGKGGNNVYSLEDRQVFPNRENESGHSYYNNQSYEYNVAKFGEGSSTTGNVYGVYDMSGGRREYVMINNLNSSIFNKKSNSGFSKEIMNYYYDNEMDTTIDLLKNNYQFEYVINNEPVTRGGYKNMGSNILSFYGATDYINKVSNETNSRAVIIVRSE